MTSHHGKVDGRIDIQKFVSLYLSGASQETCAIEFGVSRSSIATAIRNLGLPNRKVQKRTKRGEDLVEIGMLFGGWEVINGPFRLNGYVAWDCKCKCGSIKRVYKSNLTSGTSKGCKVCATVKHGMAHTPTWVSWQAMLERCTNKSHEKFNLYGGRGIKVCEEWKDFANFFRDMGVRPDSATLERKNGDLDYCKENCKWASMEEQNNNRSNNRLYSFCGEMLTASQIARKTGLSHAQVRYRMKVGKPLQLDRELS